MKIKKHLYMACENGIFVVLNMDDNFYFTMRRLKNDVYMCFGP